jgi:hypothetical protein
MPKELEQLIRKTIDAEFPLLQALAENDAARKPGDGWSRKEELGHLIDSASNNHLRFVKAALEPDFHGAPYDQNGSVLLHGYQELSWIDLLEFWRRYNMLLGELVGRIPQDKLQTSCRVGDSAEVTLQFLIEDYVAHMQHHLDHIVGRDKMTQYPGAALGV